jgi:hypothetical protein
MFRWARTRRTRNCGPWPHDRASTLGRQNLNPATPDQVCAGDSLTSATVTTARVRGSPTVGVHDNAQARLNANGVVTVSFDHAVAHCG